MRRSMKKIPLEFAVLTALLLSGCAGTPVPDTKLTPVPQVSPVIPEARETGSLAEDMTRALDQVGQTARDMGEWAEEKLK